MTQLKRILAATDLSAPARHAAERAALVARAASAQLDLVHVGSSLARLRNLAADLHARYGVSAATHVAGGPLLEGIEDTTHAVGADLLVLGARGRSKLRRLFLGSTAARLVSGCELPVLVVKRTPATEYRCVLVPVDFSEASLPAVQLARAVAPKARIVLMHAYEAHYEGRPLVAGIAGRHLAEYQRLALVHAQARMADLQRSAGLPAGSVSEVLVHGPAAPLILQQEGRERCDLIVTERHGHSYVEDLLVASVSRKVLAESAADVLVLP
jgi:nucleotide-binding universal stress UspA family protein